MCFSKHTSPHIGFFRDVCVSGSHVTVSVGQYVLKLTNNSRISQVYVSADINTALPENRERICLATVSTSTAHLTFALFLLFFFFFKV